MKKLEKLRDWLIKSGAVETDQLHIASRDGNTDAGHSLDNHNFVVHYIVKVVITNYAKDPRLILALTQMWLDLHDPSRLPNALQFKSDVLDHEKSDVELQVALQESVFLTATEQGIEINDCPTTIYPDGWEDDYKHYLERMKLAA